MSRVILAIVGVLLLVVIGCSNKEKDIKPKDNLESNKTKKENNTTKVELNATKRIMMVIPEEFIPEHIKRSHIEVVPH